MDTGAGLPGWTAIALAAVLAASMALGFLAPPRRRQASTFTLGALTALAAGTYLGAVLAAVLAGLGLPAALLALAGGELVCLAAWLERGHGGGGGGGEGPEPEDEPVPPFDWDEFERRFRDYARRPPRDPAVR